MSARPAHRAVPAAGRMGPAERAARPTGARPALAAWRSAVAAALLALAGCAPLPPAPSQPGAPPQPGAARPSRAGAVTPKPRIVPADSTPSREALEVLSSIPEPLPPSQRVPPPPSRPGPAVDSTAAAPAAPVDTGSAADSGVAEVPTPSPTLPLGERHPSILDTTAAHAPAEPGAAAAPRATPQASPAPRASGGKPHSPGAAAAVAADTCWRVQIGAPLQSDKAEALRGSASSLLLVPMVVEHEARRYKVRTRDCLSREAADLLRRRAVQSGFTQAFRVSRIGR